MKSKNTPTGSIEELIALSSLEGSTGKVVTADGRDLAAVLLGRRGGLKGGKARAASMSAERRSEVARLAAQKRWSKGEMDE